MDDTSEVKNLQETIINLIALQDCDVRIRNTQIRREEGPRRVLQLEEELEQTQKEWIEKSEQMEEQKRERKSLEQTISDFDERIQKAAIKLSNIKTNKEYRAAIKETEDLKREKSRVEDSLLELMDTIELLDQESRQNAELFEQRKRDFENTRQQILQDVESCKLEMKTLSTERERLCQFVDVPILKRYDFLKGHRKDVAISPVIKGVCQACHIGIPPQKFNELIRGDELMNCPNCSRIIYWGDDDRYRTAGPDQEPNTPDGDMGMLEQDK